MQQMVLGGPRGQSRRERAFSEATCISRSFPEAEAIGLFGDAAAAALQERDNSSDGHEVLQSVEPLEKVSVDAARSRDPAVLDKISDVQESEQVVISVPLEE